MNSRLILVALTVVLLSTTGCSTPSAAQPAGAQASLLATAASQPPAPRVGRLAPDFEAPLLNGEGQLDLAELRGRPVVLNFWATWCGPCRLEMPILQAVQERGGPDLAVVGVQVESSPEDGRAFLEEVGVRFPVVHDDDGRIGGLYLKRAALPTTFFIDRQGVVRYVQVGPMTEAFLRERLRDIGA